MDLFVIESGGIKRSAVEVRCTFCNRKFVKATRKVAKNKNNFCCRSHVPEYQKKTSNKIKIEVTCAFCEKSFRKIPSSFINSKSGLYFCTRICKDKGQRLTSGLTEIHPPHYNSDGSKTIKDYRTAAFRAFDRICSSCGYDEVKEILQVHHIDEDRTNNKLENLEVVCPTCHAIKHLESRLRRG